MLILTHTMFIAEASYFHVPIDMKELSSLFDANGCITGLSLVLIMYL